MGMRDCSLPSQQACPPTLGQQFCPCIAWAVSSASEFLPPSPRSSQSTQPAGPADAYLSACTLSRTRYHNMCTAPCSPAACWRCRPCAQGPPLSSATCSSPRLCGRWRACSARWRGASGCVRTSTDAHTRWAEIGMMQHAAGQGWHYSQLARCTPCACRLPPRQQTCNKSSVATLTPAVPARGGAAAPGGAPLHRRRALAVCECGQSADRWVCSCGCAVMDCGQLASWLRERPVRLGMSASLS